MKRSVSWISEMSLAMRRVGALQASRTVTKDGHTEEWSLTLGPEPTPLTYDLPTRLHAPAPGSDSSPIEPEAEALAAKRAAYFDLLNQNLSDAELATLPNIPIQNS